MNERMIRVLLVEDQEANIEAWNDRTEAHNSDSERHGFEVDTLYAKSVTEAQLILQTGRPEAVIVDLRLQGAHDMAPNDHGNALVTYAREHHPVPIAIYTGQAQEAEVAGFPQIKVFDRGNGLDQVFQWLNEHKNMLFQLRKSREVVERKTAQIFFKAIWPRWSKWSSNSDVDVSAMLSRHVIAHIHDSLLNANGGDAHAEECYFSPPIKDRLDTGDILNFEGNMWIVVTPRCDLANADKVATVLLAKCSDISDRWKNEKERKRLSQHDGAAKNHFLPARIDDGGKILGPWFVQFNHIQSFSTEQRDDLTSLRQASLAPQFVPSLVERFGAYFSRIGTPNISFS